MTKPYHITQEALRAGINAYEEVTGGRLPDADGEDFRIVGAIANAVLGEVLGEPVGEVADMAAEGCPPMHCFRFNAQAEDLSLGTKLYAPKGLT